MSKAYLLVIIVIFGLFASSCKQSEEMIVLKDLTGLTESQIIETYKEYDLNITFREVPTNEVPVGEFYKYGSNKSGDEVEPGANIRIDIAISKPSAPTIIGLIDETFFVSVIGNPPEFDPFLGVKAFDYLGNEITQGSFFFISRIEDSVNNPIAEVNFYQIGTYTIFYQVVNSGFSTIEERIISVIIPPFDTDQTDKLRLTQSYEGLSFLDNGIGEVIVTSFVDADTTNFEEVTTGRKFTVRYLGIDAPEATSRFEPWGIKAASFVRQKLSNADKIILQFEQGLQRQDGNGRYLAWVWYVVDGKTRLLNLELVEQAYAWTPGAGTQYSDYFEIAAAETLLTRRRIHGETDPDFDYSSDGTPIEIGTLLDNFDDYIARKVTISGIITSKVGHSVFIEQDGRGIFLYTGFNLTNELQIGYKVTIQGLVATVHFGGKQVTNYSEQNMKLDSINNDIIITTINGNQMADYVGRVVRFTNLMIEEIRRSEVNNAYTVIAVDDNGNKVHIRVDNYTSSFVPSHLFIVGNQISVFGPVTQFHNSFQLMLPGVGNIEFK